MNRSTLQVAVVALLAATAIVAVAGSVDDAQTTGGGAAPGAPTTMMETEVERTMSGPADQTNTPVDRSGRDRECVEGSERPLLWFGVVVGLTGIVGAVYWKRGQMEAISIAMILLVLLFFVYSLFGVCYTGGIPEPENRSGAEEINETRTDFAPGGSGGGAGEGDQARDLPLALVAIVAVVAVAAVGAVLVTRGKSDDDDPFDSLEEPDEAVEDGLVDVDEFAAAAGRAADRIEDGDDVDNEIYRAWVEMTEHLDVDHPESSTPGEFAAAAVDAGIDRDDVVELTELFERVRYGHTAATSDREARALDALRRIESQYGGEDA
jgi:preprotein translocase subunit SecG